MNLYQQLSVAQRSALVLRETAESNTDPREKHEAEVEVRQNEQKLAMLNEQIANAGICIQTLEQVKQKILHPGTRSQANAKTRIEEAIFWLKDELGEPCSRSVDAPSTPVAP